MVQILENPNPSIAGRLGKGIAQGLAEQLPQEIKRGRLSYGLNQLSREDLSGQNQLGILSKLYSIPGVAENPKLAEMALQQIQNRNFFGDNPNLPEEDAAQNRQIVDLSQKQPSEITAVNGSPRAPNQVPMLEEKSSNYGIPLSGKQIENIAKQEYFQNPNRFKSWNEYVDYAQKQDDKRVAKEQAFETRQVEANTRFDKGLEEITHKGGERVYEDLPGTAIKTFKNKIAQKVNQGISPARAADEVLNEALPLIQARNNIARATGFYERTFKEDEKSIKSKFNSAREVYKKDDNLKMFRDDLMADGLSAPYAGYLSYPIKEHKEVNNYISNLEKVSPKNVLSGTYESGERPTNHKKTKSEDQIASDLYKMIDRRDSILGIALALQGRGYDAQEFVNEIALLNLEKSLLNPQQADELTLTGDFKPSLMDAYLFSRVGLNPLQVQP